MPHRGRKFRLGLWAAVIWLAGVGVCWASTVPGGDADGGVLVRTLENGLTVVLRENHTTPLAALRIYVKAGSMFEGKYLGTGISHLLEHLVAGGTTSTRTEEETEHILNRIGAQTNAYTTLDHTCYHGVVPAEHLKTLIKVMADWVQNAAITPKEFAREKAVVTREVELAHDNPRRKFHRALLRTAFRLHPIRHPVLGYPELFRRLTRRDLLDYYRRMYTPNNMVVAVVGDFRSGEVLRVLEEAFGGFERRGVPLPVLPTEMRQLSRRFLERTAPIARTYMGMCFHTVPLSHPDLYPLDLVSFILSRGRGSRLVRRLRDEEGLVYEVSTYSATPYYGCGRFVVTMDLPYSNVSRVEKEVLEELERLGREGVSPGELARAKRQITAEERFAVQTVEDQAADIGYNFLATGDPLFSRTYLRGIRAVTVEDIRRVARRYFRPTNLTVVVFRPRTAAGPAGRRVVSSRPSAGGALRLFRLPNGLTVILKRRLYPPLVAVHTYFLGGVRSESERTSGISRLTALMLTKGTTTRSADEIAEFFDRIGARVSAGAGYNTFFLNLTVLPEDFEEALEVYADCLLHPTFPAEELARLRRRTLARIDQQTDDPIREAFLLFRREFFKGQPYRFTPLGSREAVSSLGRDDLVDYYRRWGVAGNAVTVVCGAIDPDRAGALLGRLLGGMPAGNRHPPAPATPPHPLEEDRILVRRTNKEQAVVFFGFRGLRLTNLEDRFAMEVLDAVVSGADLPGGWLHKTLRGKGLVYVVHAFNWMGLDPGFFGGYAVCQPAKANEVAATIRSLLDRAKSADIPQEELERAKQLLVSAHLRSLQTAGEEATSLALSHLYGLGLDFDRVYPQRIRAVSAEDVRRVARKYLTHWVVVIARPGEGAGRKGQTNPQNRAPGG